MVAGRPYVAELGFIGTAAEQYNFMLGGDRYGLRLNKLYKENFRARDFRRSGLSFSRFVNEKIITKRLEITQIE